MTYRDGVYVGEGLPGDPEPTAHVHDLRIDPYTVYPRGSFDQPRAVKVVCIIDGCSTEFIGAVYDSPHNKQAWPKWEQGQI